jgi:N-methylhydantoinase A
MTRVRIGIDVGGTFTDVVVIDSATSELVGQLKLPTTHRAGEGVALGIVRALEGALSRFSIRPGEVSFIAHSTTQATNALLEGDVARVGIIGMGRGLESILARRATRVPPIPLTPSRNLVAAHRFVRLPANRSGTPFVELIKELSRGGAQVIVASESFGVDRPDLEARVAELARAEGLSATSGHEVSGLYGLRVRTRTALINAAILPKMVETAEMTDRCVRSAGIDSPLMIMRSDGGVMSVAEVRRRPILTMLSGPAAGIAGALMHERVSDGIFVEVGGTSADVSVIRDGSPATRPARLGGHRMYLNTLDVRTIGVAGGSLIRVSRHDAGARGVVAVGPRSAHIAGFPYCCFADPEALSGGTLEWVEPAPGDTDDHVVIRGRDGRRYAITATCAANMLGLIPPGDFARGNGEATRIAFGILAGAFKPGTAPTEIARRVLETGCHPLLRTIEGLLSEYQMDRRLAVLVGGGGGAAALVPFAAGVMGLEHRLARNAEVISPIGVAMAMVRDTVERNIIDPSPKDILRVRREAADAAVTAGAVPESIEVQVEVDRRRNTVRAVAVGTTEIRRRDDPKSVLSGDECRHSAARSMRLPPSSVELVAATGPLLVFRATVRHTGLNRFLRAPEGYLRVVDRTGVVRLQRADAEVVSCSVATVGTELERLSDRLTDFGDAGREIPDVFILRGARIANFSGLAELGQLKALVEVELESVDPSADVVVLACRRKL